MCWRQKFGRVHLTAYDSSPFRYILSGLHNVRYLTYFVDVEETVVGKVLATLTSLCELGLFQKMRIWELMSATLGFLYHPNVWIRQGKMPYILPTIKVSN